MPDLMDRIYCSEQIHIPPTFPYIMKLYCKAAIRTQPYDLLKWSAAYFRALANGEEPPVKERVEYPPYDSPSGLTPGYIKILINQFGKDPATTVTAQTLFKKWGDICLDEYLLVKLIALLGAYTVVNWVQFVGVCAGFISRTLTQTMVLICELFTEEPEGGMATIPYELFTDLYIFLAEMECGPLTEAEQEKIDAILYEEDVCEVADKIKRGLYEAEGEGEFMVEEEERGEAEETAEEEAGPEKEEMGEAEETPKKLLEGEDAGQEEVAKEEKTQAQKDEEDKQKELLKKESEEFEDEDDEKTSAKSSLSDDDLKKSEVSEEGEVTGLVGADKSPPKGSKVSVQEKKAETVEPEVAEEKPKEEEVKESKRLLLEDLEDTIREKIEEKLAEEEESYVDEEEKEFQELGSYLLGAAARVQKFTAETLGFKIFKRFMRQEVPGIGPTVDSEQVEKVIDFLDSWAHKQELMVMPRNIRHWMCPPLDKVPTPQP